DLFAFVPDALALVRLGRTDATDVGRELTDRMPIGATDGDVRRVGHRAGDALGHRQRDRVREADLQPQRRAGKLGVVADPMNLELLLEGRLHALDDVVDHRPRHAVQGTILALVVGPRDANLVRVLVEFDRNARRTVEDQLAFRPLDLDGV